MFIARQRFWIKNEAICSTRLPPSAAPPPPASTLILWLSVDVVSAHETRTETRYPDASSQLHHALETSTFPLKCFRRRPGVCPQLRWECFCLVKLTHTPGASVSSSLTTSGSPSLGSRMEGGWGATVGLTRSPLLAAWCIVLKGVACLFWGKMARDYVFCSPGIQSTEKYIFKSFGISSTQPRTFNLFSLKKAQSTGTEARFMGCSL